MEMLFNLNIFLKVLPTVLIFIDKVYSYDYLNQNNWDQQYPNCSGEMQSPINLDLFHSIITTKIPRLNYNHFRRKFIKPMQLRNNGHSVYLEEKYKTESGVPAIEGGILPKGTFLFKSMHFHWGEDDIRGSEHLINGKQYSLELHIVFVNNKYKNFTETQNYPDALAVIAILFKAASFPHCCNNKIELLLKNLKFIRNADSQTDTDSMDIRLLDILGRINRNKFFTYRGSLTTPPCSPAVTWIVFSDILLISKATMKQFRKLRNQVGRPVVDNYRYIQPIGNRIVYYRFSSSNRINKLN